MRYLIDTNIWIYAAAEQQPAEQALRLAAEAEWTGFSAITRLELFSYPELTFEEETALEAILRAFSEVAVNSAAIDRAIEVRRSRRVRIPDAIIAATALNASAVLVTRNVADFRGIDGLEVWDPYESCNETARGAREDHRAP